VIDVRVEVWEGGEVFKASLDGDVNYMWKAAKLPC